MIAIKLQMQILYSKVKQLWSSLRAEPDWETKLDIFPLNNGKAHAFGQDYSLSPRQVYRLHELFKLLDVRCSGAIRLEELTALFGESAEGVLAAYLKALIAFSPMRGDDRLDFFAWAVLMVELALLDEEGLARLVFRMLDSDNDEEICIEDLVELGERLYPGAPLADYYRLNLGLRVPFDRFFEHRQHFALLLFPAHELQARAQATLFGQGFWRKFAHKAGGAVESCTQAESQGAGDRAATREAGGFAA